jgi:hypothetical protein
VAYQEQVSQIDSKISVLESRKAAAENLGFADNADVLQREIDVLQQQRNQIQTQLSAQNSAAGQTAQARLNDVTTPNPAPDAISAEQKNNVDAEKSGQLSAKVNQAQDPVAVNKQNAAGGTDQKKSEANFVNGRPNTNASSVVSTNATATGKT